MQAKGLASTCTENATKGPLRPLARLICQQKSPAGLSPQGFGVLRLRYRTSAAPGSIVASFGTRLVNHFVQGKIMTYAILTPSRQTSLKIRGCWVSMHNRCYSPKTQAKHPCYVGCSVHEDWHNFKEFESWMLQQDFQGKSLDKDILVFGNKVYGPDTCVFVTPALNALLHAKRPGSVLLGVSRNGSGFASSIYGYGEIVYLGCHATPYKAHRIWQAAKVDLIENYPLDNESPSIQPRLRIALDSRAQRIRDDLNNNRITERP